MFFEKAAFPISIDLSEVQEKINAYLKDNSFEGYLIGSSKLMFIPYWFFSYDIFEEKDGKVEHHSKGFNALNGFTKEFEEEISELNLHYVAKDSEAPANYEYDVFESKFSEKDANEFIVLKIASIEGSSKDNVMLYGLKMFYVPIWNVTFNMDNQDFVLKVNATTSQFLNLDILPQKKKTTSEIASETIAELSNPVEWINYSVGIISDLFKNTFNGKPSSEIRSEVKSAFKEQDVRILLLATIAIIVVLVVVYNI